MKGFDPIQIGEVVRNAEVDVTQEHHRVRVSLVLLRGSMHLEWYPTTAKYIAERMLEAADRIIEQEDRDGASEEPGAVADHR